MFTLENRIDLYNPSNKEINQRWLVMSVSFCFDERNQSDRYKDRIVEVLQEQIVTPLQKQKVNSIVPGADMRLLPEWVVKRLYQKLPQFISVIKVAITTDSGELISQETFEEHPQAKKGKKADTGNVENSGEQSDLLEVLKLSSLVSRYGYVENYNSQRELRRIEDMLSSESKTGMPLTICNFICPPYVGESKALVNHGYVSVSDDFSAPPKSYNFDYDYLRQIRLAESVHEIATARGFKVAAYLVLGDWGLISIDRLRATNGSDKVIIEKLRLFREGMEKHLCTTNSPVQLTGFQDIGASDLMPIGLAYTLPDRVKWIRSLADENYGDDLAGCLNFSKIEMLLSLIEDPEMLEDLLDWKNYNRIFNELVEGQTDNTALSKEDFTYIAKVYNNVSHLRHAQLSPEEKNKLKEITEQSVAGHEFRAGAFVDTLVRHYQYQIYATLFSRKFGPALCLYNDDGFSSCGHFFKTDLMKVIFLDTGKVIKLAETPGSGRGSQPGKQAIQGSPGL